MWRCEGVSTCRRVSEAGVPTWRAISGASAGRPLRAGDRLDVGAAGGTPVLGPRRGRSFRLPEGGATVRFVPGPDLQRFDGGALEHFTHSRFTVGSDSNRMGYRLQGPAIGFADPAPVLSAATPPGTIQVPPSGHPILLMADRQTTGGLCGARHGDHRRSGGRRAARSGRLDDLRCLRPSRRDGRPDRDGAGTDAPGGFVTDSSVCPHPPDRRSMAEVGTTGARLVEVFGDRIPAPGAAREPDDLSCRGDG